ncbi:MAG: (Fe-S)-binding protein [Chloroflexi bacterium]|nr:(Fe-S)-binding protein [Chloroflexota bacterium]
MASLKRDDPRGKTVSFFVTCMIDTLHPETGMAAVEVLEHLGCKVVFPKGQTCCGQPAFNGGYWHEARQVAEHYLDIFDDAEVIVTPSGSCATMVIHEFPRLFTDDRERLTQAERLASITWEFTEFIVEGLGVTDLGGKLAEACNFAFHDSCHGLRHMGLKSAARTLVRNIENAEVVELPAADVCCGFGGLFSVKMSEISGAMLDEKTAAICSTPAQVLGGDISCIVHINGGLAKQHRGERMLHIADVLARAIKQEG